MIGLGTIINTVAIIIGGFIGLIFGNRLSENMQSSMTGACGISVLFIGICGAMKGMMTLSDSGFGTQHELFVVVSIALGAFIGELIDIEGKFEAFGEWLKKKTGNAKDKTFVDAFVSASFTVCIGAMTIVGSLNDGLYGDYTILATKAVLDFIIVIVMTCSIGKGAMFSAIPVFAVQGIITLLAKLIKPIMTTAALADLSMVGSILIFCVGVNLVWGKKIRVANLLPAIIFAVAFSFLPFNF